MTGCYETSNFQDLVREYYATWFRFHPEQALEAGVLGFEHRLEPITDEDSQALYTLNNKLCYCLGEFSYDDLATADKIDSGILYAAALIENQRLRGQDWRFSDPARYLPVNSIYQLTIRKVGNFKNALRHRLLAIPARMQQAQTHLLKTPEYVVPLWVEEAIKEGRAGARFFRQLPDCEPVKVAISEDSTIPALIAAAATALDVFVAFLENELGPQAQGKFACGTDMFNNLLRYHHFLETDASALYNFGKQLFEQTEAELKAVTKQIRGDENIAALHASIKADCPRRANVILRYQDEIDAAKQFVKTTDLLSFPETESLLLMEAPGFMIPRIPWSAYLPTTPKEIMSAGRYFVSLEHDALAGHNNRKIAHTCIHATWPGHHLQFTLALQNQETCTLPRLLHRSSTLSEGWALYSEQLMAEHGYLNRPENQFILLRDRLHQAMRIMIDVDIHTRDMPIERAAIWLREVLGIGQTEAMAEVLWHSRCPTEPMGYATGWALINAAKKTLGVNQDKKKLKAFHDQLLSQGSIALPLVLQHIFGNAVWEKARNIVFS